MGGSLLEATKGCKEWALVDEEGDVLQGEICASREEIRECFSSFGSREEAVAKGIVLNSSRYEVHRHHPPLVYGREHRNDPEESDGFVLIRIRDRSTGKKLCAIAIYSMPLLSAYVVPKLVRACKEHIGDLE